jgi:hypothetical protein
VVSGFAAARLTRRELIFVIKAGTTMTTSISCPCGAKLQVSEATANVPIPCSCGRTIDVPSLEQLRPDDGLAHIGLPLDCEVSRLLESGEIPTTTSPGTQLFSRKSCVPEAPNPLFGLGRWSVAGGGW